MGNDVIGCFVYGTLRPGGHNFEWAQEGLAHGHTSITNVEMPGRLYHSYGPGSYPIADIITKRPPEAEEWIKGDILFFEPDSPEWSAVAQMEYGAGYSVILAPAFKNGQRIGEYFVWDYTRSKNFNGRIPILDGDFMRAMREYQPPAHDEEFDWDDYDLQDEDA